MSGRRAFGVSCLSALLATGVASSYRQVAPAAAKAETSSGIVAALIAERKEVGGKYKDSIFVVLVKDPSFVESEPKLAKEMLAAGFGLSARSLSPIPDKSTPGFVVLGYFVHGSTEDSLDITVGVMHGVRNGYNARSKFTRASAEWLRKERKITGLY